jgi:hypothetical protein
MLYLSNPLRDGNAARAVILAEVAGMAPHLRGLRDLAMLQCFIDESGYPAGPVLVLAGWIASAETWARFSVDWQECLDMRPPIKALKMSEAFKSWGDRSQERIARFHRIIDEHALGSVSIAIPVKEYSELFGNLSVWRDPYIFAFFCLIQRYREHCDKIGSDRDVKFIFDNQSSAKVRVAEAWSYFEQAGNERLMEIMGGFPSFEDDKKFLPLQAADMAAWWIRRQIEDRGKGVEPPSVPWRIKDSVPSIRVRYDESALRQAYSLMFE